MAKYCYTITIDNFECDCYSVKKVVEVINERSKCRVVTTDMINTLLTRPEKANKRLFRTVHDEPCNNDKISVDRRALPSKGEIAQTELNKINTMTKEWTL